MKPAKQYVFPKRAKFAGLLRSCIVVSVMLTAAWSHGLVAVEAVAQEPGQNNQASPKSAAPLGTIKAISGNTLVLTSDAGVEMNVDVRDSTKIVRIAPGQKDLKDAQTIA